MKTVPVLHPDIPPVVASLSMQRVLVQALEMLEMLPDHLLTDSEQDKRNASIDDLETLLQIRS